MRATRGFSDGFVLFVHVHSRRRRAMVAVMFTYRCIYPCPCAAMDLQSTPVIIVLHYVIVVVWLPKYQGVPSSAPLPTSTLCMASLLTPRGSSSCGCCMTFVLVWDKGEKFARDFDRFKGLVASLCFDSHDSYTSLTPFSPRAHIYHIICSSQRRLTHLHTFVALVPFLASKQD